MAKPNQRVYLSPPTSGDEDSGRHKTERRVAIRKKPKCSVTTNREHQPDSKRGPARCQALSLKKDMTFPGLISTSLDKKTDFLLRSFSTSHLARIYWNDAQSADHNKYVVPLAFQKPALFNAMMAKSLTDFQTVGGALPADCVPSSTDREQSSLMIDFAFFKMQTLKGLRATLESKTASQTCPSVIMTIVFLLKMELLGGSLDDARLHVRAIQKLLRGGRMLEAFSPCAQSPSLFTINLACLTCQEAPFMVPTSYASTTMTDEVIRALNGCKITHLSNLARGFSNPSTIKLLCPQILCYIPWQRNFVILREMAALGQLKKMTVEDYGIASSMVHRADYHLLTLPYLSRLSPLANVVRLVLLISDVATFIGLPPGTTFVSCLASQLKDALEAMGLKQLEDFEDGAVQLILWACFYGAELSTGLEGESWFLSYVRQSQKILQLHRRVEVFDILVSFMYTKRQFDKMSAKVWDDAKQRESRECSDVDAIEGENWSPQGIDLLSTRSKLLTDDKKKRSEE